MTEPTAFRIPKDTMIEFRSVGEKATCRIYMTLETLDQVAALQEVIDKAILPLMQMSTDRTTPTGTGSVT